MHFAANVLKESNSISSNYFHVFKKNDFRTVWLFEMKAFLYWFYFSYIYIILLNLNIILHKIKIKSNILYTTIHNFHKIKNFVLIEFKQAFDIFDEDGGGDISTKELGSVLKMLGQTPSRDELNKIIEEVDVDGKFCACNCYFQKFVQQQLLLAYI